MENDEMIFAKFREEERNRKIYELVECEKIGKNNVYYRRLKPDIDWTEYLFPEERTKFDKLSKVDQLSICLSCDPINALKIFGD